MENIENKDIFNEPHKTCEMEVVITQQVFLYLKTVGQGEMSQGKMSPRAKRVHIRQMWPSGQIMIM